MDFSGPESRMLLGLLPSRLVLGTLPVKSAIQLVFEVRDPPPGSRSADAVFKTNYINPSALNSNSPYSVIYYEICTMLNHHMSSPTAVGGLCPNRNRPSEFSGLCRPNLSDYFIAKILYHHATYPTRFSLKGKLMSQPLSCGFSTLLYPITGDLFASELA